MGAGGGEYQNQDGNGTSVPNRSDTQSDNVQGDPMLTAAER
jgi:hypothetical protein